MKLTLQGLQEKEQWKNAGIGLPSYDIEKVAEETKKNPVWVHFGAGKSLIAQFHFLQQS